MPMVGGNQAGVGGIQLATSPVSTGGGGGGACGCFPISDLVHHTEGGGGLDTIDVSGLATDEEWVYWVESVGAPFRLDRSALAAGLTVDHITVEAVLGEPNSRFVRLQWQNPTWQAQIHWAIDHDNGSDENLGCGTTDAAALLVPLATTAEWRRRVDGAKFTATVQVNVRRSNLGTVDDDDGLFVGFTTPIDSNFSVNVVGVATVLANGTGTLSAAQQRNLNTPQTITDAAQNWAGNSLISSTTRNCMVRKTNGAWHAFVLEAISATQVLISNPTNVSETPSATPADSVTEPVAGDTYQVCSLTPWPEIRSAPGGRVRKYLIDTVASTTPSANAGRLQSFDIVLAVLCGWRVQYACNQQDAVSVYTSNFAAAVTLGSTVPRSCGFMAAVSLQNGFSLNLQTLINTFVLAAGIQVRHNGALDCCGIMYFHNLGATIPITVDFMSRVSLINGQLFGTGMTSQLLGSDRCSQIYGAINAQAATTSGTRYVLDSITGDTLPMVDIMTGGAIHR